MKTDDDHRVRRRAKAAIEQIEHKRASRSVSVVPLPPLPKNYKISTGQGDPGFGRRQGEIDPSLYIQVKSASDRSPRRVPSRVRKWRSTAVKRHFREELRSTPGVTTSAQVAEKLRMPPYRIDVSILELTNRVNGSYIDVQCTIRVAISDHRDKMLSFVNGTATVRVPKESFSKSKQASFDDEAIANAIKSAHGNLIHYLRRVVSAK